jgi:hypothetical protein
MYDHADYSSNGYSRSALIRHRIILFFCSITSNCKTRLPDLMCSLLCGLVPQSDIQPDIRDRIIFPLDLLMLPRYHRLVSTSTNHCLYQARLLAEAAHWSFPFSVACLSKSCITTDVQNAISATVALSRLIICAIVVASAACLV